MKIRARGRSGEWVYMDFPTLRQAKERNPYLYDFEVCEK